MTRVQKCWCNDARYPPRRLRGRLRYANRNYQRRPGTASLFSEELDGKNLEELPVLIVFEF